MGNSEQTLGDPMRIKDLSTGWSGRWVSASGLCLASIRAASGGMYVRMHDGKYQQLRADRMNGIHPEICPGNAPIIPQYQKIDSRLLDFYGTIGVEVGHAHP